MLPNKENDSIMISEYPEYSKDLEYEEEEKEIEELLEYVTLFRNKLHEINCGKEFEITTQEKDELLFNLLKLNDKYVGISKYNDCVTVNLYNYNINIYFDNSNNLDAEIESLEKEKTELTTSIERREILLSNENYVNKAPSAVVEKDRIQLQKEKERLEFIISELENIKK